MNWKVTPITGTDHIIKKKRKKVSFGKQTARENSQQGFLVLRLGLSALQVASACWNTAPVPHHGAGSHQCHHLEDKKKYLNQLLPGLSWFFITYSFGTYNFFFFYYPTCHITVHAVQRHQFLIGQEAGDAATTPFTVCPFTGRTLLFLHHHWEHSGLRRTKESLALWCLPYDI